MGASLLLSLWQANDTAQGQQASLSSRLGFKSSVYLAPKITPDSPDAGLRSRTAIEGPISLALLVQLPSAGGYETWPVSLTSSLGLNKSMSL